MNNSNHAIGSHSGIGYVNPRQGQGGQDVALLMAHVLHQQARHANPAGPTRNWDSINAVALNHEQKAVLAAATKTKKPHES